MPRKTSRRFSELDDDWNPFDLRGLIDPRMLGSISAESLGELVRTTMILGSLLAAVIVWRESGWVEDRTARWLAGIDDFTLRWAAFALRGRPTVEALRQAHIGSHTRAMMSVFGLLGGLFALLGGVGGGLLERSYRRVAKLGFAGFGIGMVVSGALCLLIVPVCLGLILRTPDARISIGALAAIDSGAAGVCGLVLGLAAREEPTYMLRLAVAGVLGASLGALLFGFIEISCFPFESELAPIPRSSLCRLIQFVCATIVPATCIAVILKAPSVGSTDGEGRDVRG